MSAPVPPADLVQLADGEHRTYARVTSRTRADVTVELHGLPLVFERATGRRRSPRVFLPPYRLASPEPPTEPATPEGTEG